MRMMLLYLLGFLWQVETVTSGNWIKVNHSIEGAWKIEKIGEEFIIVLEHDFLTKKAPDLKLFLSKQPLEQLTSKNAISNAVFIAELESNKGSQSYMIEERVDLSAYQTIIMHCEKYRVLWGGAPLNL